VAELLERREQLLEVQLLRRANDVPDEKMRM